MPTTIHSGAEVVVRSSYRVDLRRFPTTDTRIAVVSGSAVWTSGSDEVKGGNQFAYHHIGELEKDILRQPNRLNLDVKAITVLHSLCPVKCLLATLLPM